MESNNQPVSLAIHAKQQRILNIIGNSLFVITIGLGYKYSENFADYLTEVIKKRENRNIKEENPTQYNISRYAFTGFFMWFTSKALYPICYKISRKLGKK
ncbi:transmembrane protein, putative (macronuclear) [Tetrahymena thermophila SB210]|uniref:Transmembrane protein, putative n=1 Tax=Tetrahymena thermophila (strain SB210) TaxID=312017 RepID=I7MD51_TETTS|nr:transmembrane protein, putative [Tetrahymena thermophila SB210]EAR85507.3 transmembrane protein, putative [Tetrahymena thermophila SB210]|eukprot:XP_001033170.3 transmembrane protein, putative [Tetrahymena thermophila SB210]